MHHLECPRNLLFLPLTLGLFLTMGPARLHGLEVLAFEYRPFYTKENRRYSPAIWPLQPSPQWTYPSAFAFSPSTA